jgi:hypothetical protein
MQPVGKKDLYDSFLVMKGGKFVDNEHSCVTLRTMVQRAIGKVQNGIEFFLQTENEPPENIQEARSRTVKCAGTVPILGKKISYHVYPTGRRRVRRPKSEDAGSGSNIESDLEQSNTEE